jgi:protein-S-isoprenylcysteine O-methyltransferase Ste14
MKNKHLLLILLFLGFSQNLFAQQVAMADQLRQDGKIWVVVAVLLVVFVGLICYLISLDRKITKLEK